MDISILNQWWKNKELINQDKSIKEYELKKYKWQPTILKELKPKINNIYTLRGPRQIGKTTLIKLLIKELLKDNDEKSCFYWS